MKQQDNSITNILFICSGNVCRSVMAEALLKDKLSDRSDSKIQVQSAGISASNGMAILPNTRAILATKGMEYTKTAQAVTSDLIRRSDLILTMTQSHKYFLVAQLPYLAEKVFTLKEYIGEAEDIDIRIPQENLESYSRCLTEIENAIALLVEKILE